MVKSKPIALTDTKLLKFILTALDEGLTTKNIFNAINENQDRFEHQVTLYSINKVRTDSRTTCPCGEEFYPSSERQSLLHKSCLGRVPVFPRVQLALNKPWVRADDDNRANQAKQAEHNELPVTAGGSGTEAG